MPKPQQGGVYKLTPSGQFTLLHQFRGCNNPVVDSLIEGSDGKLYGTTEPSSVIFSLTKQGEYKELFAPGSTPWLCPCTIVQASDGVIYGTSYGGGLRGAGMIFAVNAGLPIPKPQAREFEPKSGAVGARVRIWGYHLLKASVTFNGVPATDVRSSGPNYVLATVPAGATTGSITVTTPGGRSTTRGSFKAP